MAAKGGQDDAAKRRIINHLNADHKDSVIRYLQHYGQIPSWKAYDGRASDVDLNALSLSCHGSIIRIPFEPPMSSYREARERVVAWDKDCRRALGQSDVTVTSYIPPTGINIVPGLAVLATMIAYSQRWWFAEGQSVERVVGSSFARFSWSIQPWLIGGMLIIHGAEMLYFASVKLPKHSVHFRARIWWLWTVSTFVEGVFAYKRFDAHVKNLREKQNH